MRGGQGVSISRLIYIDGQDSFSRMIRTARRGPTLRSPLRFRRQSLHIGNDSLHVFGGEIVGRHNALRIEFPGVAEVVLQPFGRAALADTVERGPAPLPGSIDDMAGAALAFLVNHPGPHGVVGHRLQSGGVCRSQLQQEGGQAVQPGLTERRLLISCQPRLRSRNKVIPVIQQRPLTIPKIGAGPPPITPPRPIAGIFLDEIGLQLARKVWWIVTGKLR